MKPPNGSRLPRVLVAPLRAAGPLAAQRVEITLAPEVAPEPRTGRVYVIFTRDDAREPRLQAGSYAGSVPFFGLDVSGLKAGEPAGVGASTIGFPLPSLRDLPAGDHFGRGLFRAYPRVTPQHGHTIWAPWDQRAGPTRN